MHISKLLQVVPPPKFLLMKHAGLDISDDGIHCIEHVSSIHGAHIGTHGNVEIPQGVIEGGDIKDEEQLKKILNDFDKKLNLSYVKVSLPEEKMYLFQTEVPDADFATIEQNIEFKLEENVPLGAADAVFYFDLLPRSITGGVLHASVSVAPRVYIEKYLKILRDSDIFPMAFEVIPKSIARAIIAKDDNTTNMIVHMMKRKTGIYIVSGGVVCFTSTISSGGEAASPEEHALFVQTVSKEISRVYSYWASHSTIHSPITKILLVGRNAPAYEGDLQNVITEGTVSVSVADVWGNTLNLEKYIPPISKIDSLEYAVATGLAIDN